MIHLFEKKNHLPDQPRILYVDFNEGRHNKFMIKGSGRNYEVRYVYRMEALRTNLQNEAWDVIFLPGWYPNNTKEHAEEVGRILMEALVKPKLIVYTGYPGNGYSMNDELRVLLPLREKGVLIAHVPWNYSDPSEHTRVEIPYSGIVSHDEWRHDH